MAKFSQSNMLGSSNGVFETRSRTCVCPRCGILNTSHLKERIMFKYNMIFVCQNCRMEYTEEISRCKDA